jgi:hypothetical protein
LHFRFKAELILHRIGHFLYQNIIILHPCSWTLPRIWESIHSAIIHNLMIPPTIYIFLQPVIGRGYLVSRIRRYSRRTERQVPICRLIRVWLLNQLTSIFCRGGWTG